MTLTEHLRAAIVTALESIPPRDRADIYVVSLFVYDRDDDPRRPTITVGYNTERRVAGCTPAPGQKAKWPIATDEREARWNYAFWLQNVLEVIFDEHHDRAGSMLLQAWAKKEGYWYSDDEEERDIDGALRKVEPLTRELLEVTVAVVKELHARGEIVRLIGRPVPVLIHELEYYDRIADQNEAANPPGLVDDFTRWVRSG